MNLLRSLLILLPFVQTCTSLHGQTVPPLAPPEAVAPPPPAAAVAPVTAPLPEPPAPAPPAAAPRVVERERTIYVPFEDLQKVFDDGGKGVFLPYKEFLELWNELTLKRDEEETKPPQDGMVSRAEYKGRVEGDVLTVEAVLTVESFKKGWQTIPLTRGTAVSAVSEISSGKAVVQARPEGYDIIVPDKGVYEIKLMLHAPVSRGGGRSTVPLGLPASAVSRFTATIPGTGWQFEVTPAAAVTSRPEGDHTEVSFFFGTGTNFNVAWSRPGAATELAPLILASTKITSEVRSGFMATKAAIDLRILRAPVREFRFSVPAGQEVLNVSGVDLADWRIEAQGDRQRLVVTTNAPIKDAWAANITLEASLPTLPAEAAVPEILVEGAVQDRGEITVHAEPQLDVATRPEGGLVQQTSAVAAEGLVSVGAFRYLKHPSTLKLGITLASPQVDVDSLARLVVERDRNLLEAQFTYNIRRVGIFEARLTLPEGWTGWEVAGVPAEKWSVESGKAGAAGGPAAKSELVFRFDQQTLGKVGFSLRAQQSRGSPTEDVQVPAFASVTPNNRYEAKIGVQVHSSLEGATKQLGDLRLEDVSSINFSPAGTAQTQQAQVLGGTLTLAFRHRNAVETPATLTFKPRPPQVNVQVLALAQVKEQSTLHQWSLAFDVGYAAIDKFILAVPKAAAPDLRLVDPLVKEVNKEYQAPASPPVQLPDAASYVLWEVTLRNEREGAFNIALSLEQPAAAGQVTSVGLLQVHVPGAFQETGQVAVVKDDSLEIRDYKAGNLEEIDPRELNAQLQGKGVFLAFKYKSLPLSLTLDVARNAFIEVPQAVVTHAVLTTAVATDQAQTTEVIYWVKNNARQFLTVHLPEGARLVSDVFVLSESQRPMKREGSQDLLVRLPSNAASQTAFPVRFVYEVGSPKAGEKMRSMGNMVITPPELVDVSVVMQTQQSLFLPETHDYTRFTGPMTLSVRDRGWGKFRGIINGLIPAFGPQFVQSSGDWKPAPAIPSQQRNTFDFQVPAQGRNFVLHRLGAPATTEVKFRSRAFSFFLEAGAFFVVIALGLYLSSKSWRTRLAFLVLFGVAGLLLTGLLSAADGQVARGAVMGAALVTVFWAACSVFRRIRGLRGSRRQVPVVSSGRPPDLYPPPLSTPKGSSPMVQAPVPAMDEVVGVREASAEISGSAHHQGDGEISEAAAIPLRDLVVPAAADIPSPEQDLPPVPELPPGDESPEGSSGEGKETKQP